MISLRAERLHPIGSARRVASEMAVDPTDIMPFGPVVTKDEEVNRIGEMKPVDKGLATVWRWRAV